MLIMVKIVQLNFPFFESTVSARERAPDLNGVVCTDESFLLMLANDVSISQEGNFRGKTFIATMRLLLCYSISSGGGSCHCGVS